MKAQVGTMLWMSPEERRDLGRARRKQMPRAGHAQLHPAARKATALDLVEQSMSGRVPALIQLKYKLMSESPFAYFRGAAPVMAADLAALPSTGIESQICGDAHVRNLGAYASPDGRLIFDINDFDETIRAPFEWDLKRMAASLVLAGRAAGQKEASARSAVEACVERYSAQMREFARMPLLEMARFQVHRMNLAKPVHDALVKAERATPALTLKQLTEKGEKPKSGRRFKGMPPVLTRVTGAQRAAVLASMKPYLETIEPQRQRLLSLYRPVDVAFKVVGTGSVGLRDYCVYMDGNGPLDPLFLQIKEEAPSAYAPYLPAARAGQRDGRRAAQHNGQRAALGQRAMQMQSDPFLGWTHIDGRQYLVRQLNDHKGSINLEDLAGGGLKAYAEVCGELLARGHARSSDPMVIAGYVGSGIAFADALAMFGSAYADQTEKDWSELRRKNDPGKSNRVRR
jgi:uncharacterized protein (DUF2252 family)